MNTQLYSKRNLGKTITFLIVVCAGSAFQLEPNSNMFSKGKTKINAAPLKTPFFRGTFPRSKCNTSINNNVCLPRSIIHLYGSSPFVAYNNTEMDSNSIPKLKTDLELEAEKEIKHLESLLNEGVFENHFDLSLTRGRLEAIAANLEAIHKAPSQTKHANSTQPLNKGMRSRSETSWFKNLNPFQDENDSNNKDVLMARCLVLFIAALYGTNFPLVKVLDEQIPVGISMSLRFSLAAIACIPWLLPSKNDIENMKTRPELFWGPIMAGLDAGFWISLAYIGQAVGLQSVDASKSAFICSLSVVCVPIFDALEGKVLSLQKIFGICLALSGVAILELGDSLFTPGSDVALHSLTKGDLFSLIQPIAFGFGFWRVEKANENYPEECVRLSCSQLVGIGLVSNIFCVITGGGGDTFPTITQIFEWLSNFDILAALAWTGIITTAMTTFLETKALKTISASEAALIFLTEPLWGSAFASIIIGERLGLEAGVGAALILGGCLFSTLEKNSDMTDKTDTSAKTKEELILPSKVDRITVIDMDSHLREVVSYHDETEHFIS